MADFYDEINTLINGIVSGRINAKEAEQYIDRLKKQYGSDSFPSFNFKKQPKPWNKEYLLELQKKNITGACSEEFILHMAEVSDYVFARKKKSITGAIAAAVIIVLLIIALALTANKSKQKDEQSLGLLEASAEEIVEDDVIIDDSEIVFI